MENLSYPIGRYVPTEFSEKLLQKRLLDIRDLPQRIEYAITNLDADQLHTAYRPQGWTVHELVHHIADSHTNAYIRFKLGLTEENPTIKPYDQDAWVKLDDTINLPINVSLTLLHALHKRWYEAIKSISIDQLNRTVYHPEQEKTISLWDLLGMYVWHGLHHEAHILRLREQMNW